MTLLACPSCGDLCRPTASYCPECDAPLLPGLPRHSTISPKPIRIHGLACRWCESRDCVEHDDLEDLLALSRLGDGARERVDLADVAVGSM